MVQINPFKSSSCLIYSTLNCFMLVLFSQNIQLLLANTTSVALATTAPVKQTSLQDVTFSTAITTRPITSSSLPVNTTITTDATPSTTYPTTTTLSTSTTAKYLPSSSLSTTLIRPPLAETSAVMFDSETSAVTLDTGTTSPDTTASTKNTTIESPFSATTSTPTTTLLFLPLFEQTTSPINSTFEPDGLAAALVDNNVTGIHNSTAPDQTITSHSTSSTTTPLTTATSVTTVSIVTFASNSSIDLVTNFTSDVTAVTSSMMVTNVTTPTMRDTTNSILHSFTLPSNETTLNPLNTSLLLDTTTLGVNGSSNPTTGPTNSSLFNITQKSDDDDKKGLIAGVTVAVIALIALLIGVGLLVWYVGSMRRGAGRYNPRKEEEGGVVEGAVHFDILQLPTEEKLI